MPMLKFGGATEDVAIVLIDVAGVDVVGAVLKAEVPSARPPVVAAVPADEVSAANENPPTAADAVVAGVVVPKLKPPAGAVAVVPEAVDATAAVPPNEKPLEAVAVPRPWASEAVVVAAAAAAGGGAPNEVGLAAVGAIVIEAGAAVAGTPSVSVAGGLTAPRPPNEKLLPPVCGAAVVVVATVPNPNDGALAAVVAANDREDGAAGGTMPEVLPKENPGAPADPADGVPNENPELVGAGAV